MDYLVVIICLLCFILGILIYMLFVSEKLKNHTIIAKQAFTDPLTKKGNRHKFLVDMDKAIERNKKFAICFMDLDGFKHVNDTFGHDAGDELLIALSDKLESGLPISCEAYRLGGDEFAIYIPNINTVDEITKILDKLKLTFEEPVIIENTKIVLEYSLGISIFPTDAITRVDLMNYADDAMYYIKEHGKNSYYFHNESLKARLNSKTKMELDLKNGIENNEFGVQFQPRICVSNVDDIYLESFIYWNHPVLGKLSADYFVKQAEEIGIMAFLDEFVLRSVCDKLEELKNDYDKNIKMCVNISDAYAKRHDLANKLVNILKDYNFNKDEIYIEFNNRLNIENLKDYKYIIDRLKEVGANIVISNLELRYDILTIFKDLNVDEIKLSSEYIDDISNFNQDILKNIIDVCHDVGFLVNISRIENKKELDYVRDCNVSKIQGNYIFKKFDKNDIYEFLENYDNLKLKIIQVLD